MVPYLFDLLGFFVERIVERVIARGIGRALACTIMISNGLPRPGAGELAVRLRAIASLACRVVG
jgi:hypothetical protein